MNEREIIDHAVKMFKLDVLDKHIEDFIASNKLSDMNLCNYSFDAIDDLKKIHNIDAKQTLSEIEYEKMFLETVGAMVFHDAPTKEEKRNIGARMMLINMQSKFI